MFSKKIEFNYFDEFIKSSNIALDISNVLNNYVDNVNFNELDNIKNTVHSLENDADIILHNILNYIVNLKKQIQMDQVRNYLIKMAKN